MESIMEYGPYSKLGPREKGRKAKGKRKPQALRQAKAKRDNFILKLKQNG